MLTVDQLTCRKQETCSNLHSLEVSRSSLRTGGIEWWCTKWYFQSGCLVVGTCPMEWRWITIKFYLRCLHLRFWINWILCLMTHPISFICLSSFPFSSFLFQKVHLLTARMLVSTWSNKNSHSMLVGMQNGVATLEGSWTISCKSDHHLTIQSAIILLGNSVPQGYGADGADRGEGSSCTDTKGLWELSMLCPTSLRTYNCSKK